MLTTPSRRARSTELPAPLPLDSLAALGAALAERPYVRRGVSQTDTLIRVFIVDDHRLVREGIRALLRDAADIEVIGDAECGLQAQASIARLGPDVIVCDLDLPNGDGIGTVRALVEAKPGTRVLVLTQHPEEERLIETLHAGASGYITKNAAERELEDAIRTVAQGEVYVRPRVAQLLAANMRPSSRRSSADAARARFGELSEREQTVLRLVAEGYNGPEIGRKLGITAKTVDTYKQRIEDKVGLAHRSDYVRFALVVDILHPAAG